MPLSIGSILTPVLAARLTGLAECDEGLQEFVDGLPFAGRPSVGRWPDNREAVQQQSPGSRSAPWVGNPRKGSRTPKGYHQTAKRFNAVCGSVRRPATTSEPHRVFRVSNKSCTLSGCLVRVLRIPGCAARPWAMLYNRFAVEYGANGNRVRRKGHKCP